MADALLFVAEIVVHDGSSATTKYYANIGFGTLSTDTPASAPVPARLAQPIAAARNIFRSGGATRGATETTEGELLLHNGDGLLDTIFATGGIDGRSLIVRQGVVGAAYPAAFTTVFRGTMYGKPELTHEFVKIKARGREQELEKPLQSTYYTGANVLPAGLEGTSELTGKPKPVCYGTVRNISPVCVNTSKLIYQVADAAVDSVDAVYDSGNTLGDPTDWEEVTGTPFTSQKQSIAVSSDNPDLMMAVGPSSGAAGEIGVSTDGGATWTLLTHGFTGNVNHVAWGGPAGTRRFVIVGGSQIATSDGVTVTMRTSGLGAGHELYAVTWFDKAQLWITGGDGGSNTLRTSPTGVTWTSRTYANFEQIGVLYAGPTRVIGGTTGATPTAAYSDDGITWTLATTSNGSDFPAGGAFFDACYANGEYRLVGGNGCMVRSIDAKSWGRIEGPFDGLAGGTAETLASIAYGHGCWVVGTNVGHFYYEGRVGWVKYPLPFSNVALNATVFDGRRFVSCWGGVKYIGRTLHGELFANLTDLEDDTLAPGPGNWKQALNASGSYVRIGSPPAGQVTADVTEGATSADRTVAQLWKRILVARGGLTAGTDTSAGDVTALDSALPGEAGYWAGPDGQINLSAALDEIVGTDGNWWLPDRSGLYRIKQLVAPSGTAAAAFTASSLKGRVQRKSTVDSGEGVPCWKVILYYSRNYTVQESGLAGGVEDDTRADLAREWRSVTSEDTAIKTKHLLAPTLVVYTSLANTSDAQAECDRLLALRKVQRDRYPIVVEATPANTALDLGSVVSLTHSRFGLSAGKKFTIVGVAPNARDRSIAYEIWGGT